MATNDDLLRELQKISAALSKKGPAGGPAGTTDAQESAFAKTEAQLQVEMEALAALTEGTKEHAEQNEKVLATQMRLAEQAGATAEEFEKLVRETSAATEETKKHTKALEEQNKELERSKGVTKNFDNALKRNIKTLTGITDGSNTLAGSFVNLAKEQGGVSGAFKQMRDTIGETITATSMATSVFAKFAEGTLFMAKSLDSATAGFSKATGLGDTFNSQIIELERNNRQFGVSANESAQAFNSLVDGLSGFTLMDQDVQSALSTEVAQLSELGVAAADSTGAFQSLTKTFGFTQQESIGLVQETEKLAGELGISLGQAINDLNASMPKLAQLSKDQLIPAFKELSKQAIETGISVDGLIGIAEGFDTFEEAATAAGNLNAVLGTQAFDTTALLEAQLEGPQAVTALLTEQLQSSVGSFDELTTFQKQAVANAAGLSTAELKNLMNAEEMTEEQKRQADERKENLKAAMDMKAELMALAAELTVALQPVFNFFKGIVSFIASISRSVRSLFGGGSLGSVASAAVMIGGGALIGKIVSKTMRALGFKGPSGKKGDEIYTYETNPAALGGGGRGGDDDPRNLVRKFGGRGFKMAGLGMGSSARAVAQSQAATAARGGTFGRLRQAYRGGAGAGEVARGGRMAGLRRAGLSGKRVAKNFGKGLNPKTAFQMARGQVLSKRGLNVGAKLGARGGLAIAGKMGARLIPGLGTALLAFEAIKFLGPKLLKGVKGAGKAILGGVKKFGGAALGLLGKAAGGLKSFGGRAVKGVMSAIGKVPVLGAASRMGMGGLKAVGRGLKKLKFWNEGTDATPSLSSNQVQIAGDGGPNAEPEMIVPPPKSAVINNANLMNALGGMAGGGGNPEMASAINNLGAKFDTLIGEVKNLNTRPVKVEATAVIGKKAFAKEVNGHFGRSSSSPATSAV